MQKVNKDVDTTWSGRTVTFVGLTVWVCSACGEEAFEPDDVYRMQEHIQRTMDGEDYQKFVSLPK